MKNTFLTVLFFFSAFIVYGQTNLRLKTTIDSLYEVDQNVQLKLQTLLENKVPFDSIQKQQNIEKQTFDRHIPIIKEIFLKNGYPTDKIVGKETSTHFFVLIQHSDSDPKFQASMLPVIKKYSATGNVSKKDYAFLYDRVQRNTGGQQLYGTQPSYDDKGNLFDSSNKIIYPKDLADPANVDKRRKKVGLQPLEKYYELILETIGRPRKKK